MLKPIYNYLEHCDTTYELKPTTISRVPKLLPVDPLLRSYDNTYAIVGSLTILGRRYFLLELA